jgi:hypothetical protein
VCKELFEVEEDFLTMLLQGQPEPPVIAPVRTGADGRFRIAGIGRERVATLLIEGPAIETTLVMVRTRPGATLRVPVMKGVEELDPDDRPEPLTCYGATFDHVAGPTRPIEGVVRDFDTGQPLAGIMVHGDESRLTVPVANVHAISDAQGRYRLVGLPRGREGRLLAGPPYDFPDFARRKTNLAVQPEVTLPYLHTQVEVGKAEGSGPVQLDIKLKRGVWVTGRILDRDTHKPVAGWVEYFVFDDNPHLKRYPGFKEMSVAVIPRGPTGHSASSSAPAPAC